MIDYEEFTDRFYPGANDARQDDIKRFLDNVYELIGNTALNVALKNKYTLCRMFYLHKTGSISRSHYQKVKEYILNLFEYVNVQGDVPSREEVIEAQNTICFFRDINALLDFIDSVGEQKIENYNPTTDLVRVKSVCVLGWIGLSPLEISNLKRGDLQPIDLNGYRIDTASGTYEVYGKPFAALFYLCDLEEYQSLPVGNSRGRKIILKGAGDYLFRSRDAECERLDEMQIIQIISRFNMGSVGSTTIIFRNLHKNALFLEIYNDKSDKGLIAKIADTFGCTENGALNYKEQYLKFAEAMDNGEI